MQSFHYGGLKSYSKNSAVCDELNSSYSTYKYNEKYSGSSSDDSSGSFDVIPMWVSIIAVATVEAIRDCNTRSTQSKTTVSPKQNYCVSEAKLLCLQSKITVSIK